MTKWIMVLLISAKLLAQENPISESSVFIYNKFNYGNDFFNAVNPFSLESNGTLWCQPYTGSTLKISNATVTEPLYLKGKNYDPFDKIFSLNGFEYYCTPRSIIVFKSDAIVKQVSLTSPKEVVTQFILSENKIYFVKFDAITAKPLQLNVFDGKQVRVVKEYDKVDISTLNFTHGKNHYLVVNTSDTSAFFNIRNNDIKLSKAYNTFNEILHIINFRDVTNFVFTDRENKCFTVKNGLISLIDADRAYYISTDTIPSNIIGNQKFLYKIKDAHLTPVANSSFGDTFMVKQFSAESNSYYCGTNTNLVRLFPHIKKYPRLFYNSNSNSVFTLQQDHLGQIWAGSYQMALSIITNDGKVIQDRENTVRFLNGGLNYKGKMLLLAESNGGLLLYDGISKHSRIADSIAGYYTYLSKKNTLYLGTSMRGIWYTDARNLETDKKIQWSIINEEQGLNLENILTISEDKFGNIWFGSGRGIGMYDIKTHKCKTWKTDDVKKEFAGSRAMVLDTYNTLWIGARNGELLFYNGKNTNDYSVDNLISIRHPLFKNRKLISFMRQWKNFLIIGATDKILLFDLKKWYENKTVSVRYLNPMEINLTNDTEQNTILTDKRDGSVWFASSDMVYQWDIKKWLTLPTFKVTPSILIKKNTTETQYHAQKNIEFSATENSFDIQVNYQTLDNMPRFLNGILVRKDEKPQFGAPDLQTKFQFKNLSPGDYVFYIRICQQDGSFDLFEYAVTIHNFFWQNWWFWVLISLIPIGFVSFYFQKRNQIERQKKKLSQLNLSSLSNQFRPHFMLNALNSIGSQMTDKPHAEKVISRLGESISILYSFTQKNEFTHPFENEWKLVENIIEIQRLLFIPELNVIIENQDLIPPDLKIPVGLLQIPVENALLHGLRNKTNGDCKLSIRFEENNSQYLIHIDDNGVGREKASRINNFRKNGNGLKTIFEMIGIINSIQNNAISFEITDASCTYGTVVKISIEKFIDYAKIKL